MSSSDSEDGYYSNLGRNIGIAREKCRKIFLNAPVENFAGKSETDKGTAGINTTSTGNVNNTTNLSVIDSYEDDKILDEILAKNSKPTRGRGRGRKKKETIQPENLAAPVTTSTRGRCRGRVAKRGRASKNNVTDRQTSDLPFEFINGNRNTIETINRTRRGRSRKNTTVSYSSNSSLEEYVNGGDTNTIQNTPLYPTYSVGNTDEYPDNSEDLLLFSKPSTKSLEKIEISDDDNEPLSVKVRWKSGYISRFMIKEHQSFSTIFDYYAKEENVDKDKLLFIYNDKILTCHDTPASIDYNIVKIIEGGTVSNSLHKQVIRKTVIDGIKIKFQCLIRKKPLEITIEKDDKLSLALIQCAERLEFPLSKLKFEFDGDIVMGSSTPQEMGLENGDCIDVVVLG